MSAPEFSITADLSQDDTLYYLPLGALSEGATEQIKLAVRLRIEHVDPNPDHDTLTINGIKFSYPGTNIDAKEMDLVPSHNMSPDNGRLNFGDTANWTSATCLDENNNPLKWNQVYLDQPAPRFVDIGITCDETDRPFVKRFSLLPRTGDPFLLPFILDELDDDEYVVTSSKHLFVGGSHGTQIYAHDIFIFGRVKGKLDPNRTDTPTQNTDSRIFGRPIRGMADGVVIKVEKTTERKSGLEVQTGGIVHRGGFGRDDDPEYETTFVECYDNPFGSKRTDTHYGRIRVTVDYDGVIVIYSHLKYQSVCVEEGDTIWPGRKIAEAGNTGNTGGTPHLHMECHIKTGTKLCGMAFKDAWMLDLDLVPDDDSPGARVHLDGLGIPKKTVALRPFTTHFEPQPAGELSVEADTLWGEVLGGASRGGDGIVIVNGKLKRVPPRGIRGEILNALLKHDEIAERPLTEQAKLRTALAKQIEALAAKLRR